MHIWEQSRRLKLHLRYVIQQFVELGYTHEFSINIFLNFLQIPWVLHPRLVHSGQEGDVSLLPWESWSQANVSDSVGEATHDVRTAAGLAEVAGMLATHHPSLGPRNQLGPGTWIAPSPSATNSVPPPAFHVRFAGGIDDPRKSFIHNLIIPCWIEHAY